MSDASEVNPAPAKTHEPHPLDALTGGAFSAATSGERASRIRDWLATQPSPEQLQEVFKELSGRDKGAARAVRERLDEIRRAKGQEAIAAEWAEKAQALLAAPKLNIADALAWQRDAAKAGAPLSREPLSQLKVQLADRVKVIEDLQHRVQVQREAAVLLAQRIEVLSTKPWRDAQAALELLRADVARWQEQAQELTGDASWASVEARFPPLLDASRTQLLVVWEAFQPAVAQAAAAAEDAAAPLPPVPVWADELRAARGVPAEAAPQAPVPETAQAPAPGQAVDDAPRQATVLGAAKVAKEADTDEVAADEAGAEEVAVDRPAAGAAAGAAVDGLARVPAREQPPGTPGELLEARNARRRGDHDAAVEAYQRYFAGYRSDDQVASAWLEAAQSYEALGNLASALQLYRLAARSQDPQVARTARERISAIESLRKDAARAPAEAAPAEAADTAPAEPAPAEQKP